MATVRLRNPTSIPINSLLAAQIGDIVRAEVTEKLATHNIERPAIFYWRGRRGRPSAASSVGAIPDSLFTRLPASVGILDKEAGGSIIAEAAVAAAERFRRLAPVATGRYAGSLKFRLNGREMRLASIVRFATSNPFSDKERVMLFPAVEYASSLESDYSRRKTEKGIMSRIARELLAQFGQRRISLKFAYISGIDLGLGYKYATPVIMIGAAGAFPSTIRNPGANFRRRKRANRTKRA